MNTDDGSQGGSHWTCLIVKDKKSNYYDSFEIHPDKILLSQMPKPIKYHNYKTQDIKPKLYGSYCLYFFNLIERMKYYDAFSKMYFH